MGMARETFRGASNADPELDWPTRGRWGWGSGFRSSSNFNRLLLAGLFRTILSNTVVTGPLRQAEAMVGIGAEVEQGVEPKPPLASS